MTPDEILALLQTIARQQLQISQLEAALTATRAELAAASQDAPVTGNGSPV